MFFLAFFVLLRTTAEGVFTSGDPRLLTADLVELRLKVLKMLLVLDSVRLKFAASSSGGVSGVAALKEGDVLTLALIDAAGVAFLALAIIGTGGVETDNSGDAKLTIGAGTFFADARFKGGGVGRSGED